MSPDRITHDWASRSANPVLIVNPRSGGGKAIHSDLVAQCRARGIEPIVFEPGENLSAIAETAIRDGAGVIGMAGGDGSQAAVGAVAARHDVPFVCIPAGTRNHFALDIGVDVGDVVGVLDAFFQDDERRIDLARVNGRVFVNNAAMGVYGAVVQSADYRDNKVRTTIRMLPGLIGPDAASFDLRFQVPDRRGSPARSCSSSRTTPTASACGRNARREVASTRVCSASSPSPVRRRRARTSGRRRCSVSTPARPSRSASMVRASKWNRPLCSSPFRRL